MFFDRYEIQIQVGVLFNNENVSFSIPCLRKNIFQYIIIFIYTKLSRFQKHQNSEISKAQKVGYTHDPNVFEFIESQITKDNMFPRCFHIFSNIV